MDTAPTTGPDPSCVATAPAFTATAAAQMERMLADLSVLYRERNQALRDLEHAHRETLWRLAAAAELRDGDTGMHIVRMGYLAEAMARCAGLDWPQARLLRMAAPMHDIGKIGLPDGVLKKAGPLSPEERLLMQEHPRMGAEILGHSAIPLFALSAEVALSHHERWDGGGYPGGLCGTAIPLPGRIVAVVDFFDALTMDRCYRSAFEDDVALAMLAEEEGHAFDPALARLFVRNAREMIALRDWVNREKPGMHHLAECDDEPDAGPGHDAGG